MARKAREEFGPGDWYSARLLFESVHDPPSRPSKLYPLFEESLIVFQAYDRDSVVDKLLEMARGKEHDYEAAAGNRVSWVFREILEVQEIMSEGGITDGTEVFYRWWHNPGPRALKTMRKTHEKPWWGSDPNGPGTGVTS